MIVRKRIKRRFLRGDRAVDAWRTATISREAAD